MIQNGALITPPHTVFLECITRDTVLKIAADLEIPIREEMITRDKLYTADEILIAGTSAEIVAFRSMITGYLGREVSASHTSPPQVVYR